MKAGVLADVSFPTPSGNVTLRDMVEQILALSPLNDQGFWNLVITNGQSQATQLSNEGYELFTDAGAYDTIPANWNATAAVIDMAADFATAPTYFALQDGYESLPKALAAQLPTEMLKPNSPVTSVRKNTATGAYTINIGGAQGNTTITADNVIFAVTPRVLQLFAADTPPDPPIVTNPLAPFADQLAQVSPVPLFKI